MTRITPGGSKRQLNAALQLDSTQVVALIKRAQLAQQMRQRRKAKTQAAASDLSLDEYAKREQEAKARMAELLQARTLPLLPCCVSRCNPRTQLVQSIYRQRTALGASGLLSVYCANAPLCFVAALATHMTHMFSRLPKQFRSRAAPGFSDSAALVSGLLQPARPEICAYVQSADLLQELEDEEEGAEAKKARAKAKRSAKKNEKKVAKRKDVRLAPLRLLSAHMQSTCRAMGASFCACGDRMQTDGASCS